MLLGLRVFVSITDFGEYVIDLGDYITDLGDYVIDFGGHAFPTKFAKSISITVFFSPSISVLPEFLYFLEVELELLLPLNFLHLHEEAIEFDVVRSKSTIHSL